MGTEQHDLAPVVNDGCPSLHNESENHGVEKQNDVDKKEHPNIYRQDVVRSCKSNTIGIVSEVAGDSDSEDDITDEEDDEDEDEEEEDGDDDDEEEDDDGVSQGNGNSKESEKQNSNNYKCGALQADQVRVLWLDETDPVQHINDVSLVDRGFMHGDYVASASDRTGQVGVVVDVNITVDLLSADGSVVKDISSKDLKRVRDFVVGDYVVNGPWLGRVDEVLDNVTVLFDDSSVCKVVRAEPLRLTPISKNTLEDDGHFPYYPGQRVRATSSSVFKNSRWLTGLWKPNRVEGTVTNVTIASVYVYWIASAGFGPDSSTTPLEEQSPKDLKLLSCFTHSTWQVGDWCLLPSLCQSASIPLQNRMSKLKIHESSNNEGDHSQPEVDCDIEDTVEESDGNAGSLNCNPELSANRKTSINKSSLEANSCSSSAVSKEPAHEPWPLHRKKIRKVLIRKEKKARKKDENFERALLITNIRTSVDVAWQDGTTELSRSSITLIPIESPGDHEYVSEQYVVEKASDEDDDATEPKRVGVVKSVNAKERTARVRWLKPVAKAEDPREFDEEEIVSVYELEGHPDYDYCYGDVVVRLSPVSRSHDTSAAEDSLGETNPQSAADDIKRDGKKRLGSDKVGDASSNDPCNYFSNLSWVGNITGLKDGDIKVTWADGMISTVGPQAIYVVERDDDDESVAAGSEVSDAAASWETVDDDEVVALENFEKEHGLQDSTDIPIQKEDNSENESGKNAAMALPLAALGFVSRLASGLFLRGRKSVDSASSDLRSESLNSSEGRNSVDESSSHNSNVDKFGIESAKGNAAEHVTTLASIIPDSDTVESLRTEESDDPANSEGNSYSFKRFDISKDPIDHHFLGANGQNSGRKWLKKVQQDWNILQKNLPDGIYVRVYEERMDLLRAVIVGAYGTPYQDGLFFFDFHLPPEYPDVPPSVYYHSGGWRINPNLYEEGKVCLSLLNTWSGRGNEVWDPASSSILQVLVSLQGLVLNSKPYFNEAGYDKQIGTAEGEKNSLGYNENTFLLNCKTMMYLMRKLPKGFEELVKEHFKKRGYFILKACDAYMKGCLIGSLTKDVALNDEHNDNSTSVGFKLMLTKIVPKLFAALTDVGADCHDFSLQQ